MIELFEDPWIRDVSKMMVTWFVGTAVAAAALLAYQGAL